MLITQSYYVFKYAIVINIIVVCFQWFKGVKTESVFKKIMQTCMQTMFVQKHKKWANEKKSLSKKI